MNSRITERMRAELQHVLTAAKELPAEDLPRLLGELEEIRCTAMARLTAPTFASPQSDELLDIDETARRLGTSKDYLYRHHARLPFTRRMGRSLRFSALGIEKYIRQRCPLDSKKANSYTRPIVERTSTV
jgi:predicted DNA-binding transcriptional regulator AlpA